MDSETRFRTTKYIWGTFLVIACFVSMDWMFTGRGLAFEHMIIFMLLAAAAMISTGFVWNWGMRLNTTEEHEKAKRLNRVDSMLELLSADELEALRMRLADDDEGAQPGLESLLPEDGELARH